MEFPPPKSQRGTVGYTRAKRLQPEALTHAATVSHLIANAESPSMLRFINSDEGFATLKNSFPNDDTRPAPNRRGDNDVAQPPLDKTDSMILALTAPLSTYTEKLFTHSQRNTVRFPIDYLALDSASQIPVADRDAAAVYKLDIERRVAALIALYRDETISDDEVAHMAIECASQCTRYAELLSFNGRFPEAFGLLEECDRVISEDRDFSTFAEKAQFEASAAAEKVARQKGLNDSGTPLTASTIGKASSLASSASIIPQQKDPSIPTSSLSVQPEAPARPDHKQRLVLGGPDFFEAVAGIRRRMLFLAKEMELKRRQQLAAIRQKERDEAERDKSAAARSGPTANALSAQKDNGPEVMRGSMSPAQKNLRQYQLQQLNLPQPNTDNGKGNRKSPPKVPNTAPTSVPIGLALAGSTASGMAPRNFYYKQYDPDIALQAVLRDSTTYNALVASSSSVAVRHRPRNLTSSQLTAVVTASMTHSSAAHALTPNSPPLHSSERLSIAGSATQATYNHRNSLAIDEESLQLPLTTNLALPLISTHHRRLSSVNFSHQLSEQLHKAEEENQGKEWTSSVGSTPPLPLPRHNTLCPPGLLMAPTEITRETFKEGETTPSLRAQRQDIFGRGSASTATFLTRAKLIGGGSDPNDRHGVALRNTLESIEARRVAAAAAVLAAFEDNAPEDISVQHTEEESQHEKRLSEPTNSSIASHSETIDWGRNNNASNMNVERNICDTAISTETGTIGAHYDGDDDESTRRADQSKVEEIQKYTVPYEDSASLPFELALEKRVRHREAEKAKQLREAEEELASTIKALDGVPESQRACQALHESVRQRLIDRLVAKIESIKNSPKHNGGNVEKPLDIDKPATDYWTGIEEERSDDASSVRSGGGPFRAGAMGMVNTSSGYQNYGRRKESVVSIPDSASTQSPTSLSPAASGYFRRISMAASPMGSMYNARNGIGGSTAHYPRGKDLGTVFTSIEQLRAQKNWAKIHPARLEMVFVLAVSVRRLQRAFRVFLAKREVRWRSERTEAKIRDDARRLDAFKVILMAMQSYVARKKAFIMHARVHYLSEQRIELELRGIDSSELNGDLRMVKAPTANQGAVPSSGNNYNSSSSQQHSPHLKHGKKEGHRHGGSPSKHDEGSPFGSTSFASSSQAALVGHNTSDESKGSTAVNLRTTSGGATHSQLQEYRFGGSTSVRSGQAPYKVLEGGGHSSVSRGPSTETELGATHSSPSGLKLTHRIGGHNKRPSGSSSKAFFMPFAQLTEPSKFAKLKALQLKIAARRIAYIWYDYRENAIVQSTIDAEVYMDHLTGRTPFPILDDLNDYAAAALRDTLTKQELGLLPSPSHLQGGLLGEMNEYYSQHHMLRGASGVGLRSVNSGFGQFHQSHHGPWARTHSVTSSAFFAQTKGAPPSTATKAPSFFGFSAVGFGGGYLGATPGSEQQQRAPSSASMRMRSMSTSTRVIPFLTTSPHYATNAQHDPTRTKQLHRVPSTASTAFQTEGHNTVDSSESQLPHPANATHSLDNTTFEYVTISGVAEPMLVAKERPSIEQFVNPKPPSNIVELVVDSGAAAIIRNGGQLRPPKVTGVANPRSRRFNQPSNLHKSKRAQKQQFGSDESENDDHRILQGNASSDVPLPIRGSGHTAVRNKGDESSQQLRGHSPTHLSSRFQPLIKVNISEVLREKEEEEAELAKWRQQELDRHQRLQADQQVLRQKKIDAVVLIQCCGRGYRRRLALLTTFVSRAYGYFGTYGLGLSMTGDADEDGEGADAEHSLSDSSQLIGRSNITNSISGLAGQSVRSKDVFAASVFALSSFGRTSAVSLPSGDKSNLNYPKGGDPSEGLQLNHQGSTSFAASSSRNQARQQGFVAVLKESPHLVVPPLVRTNNQQDYGLSQEAMLEITKMIYLRNPSVFPVAQARLQMQRVEAATAVQALLRARASCYYCDVIRWRASAVVIQRAWRRRRNQSKNRKG